MALSVPPKAARQSAPSRPGGPGAGLIATRPGKVLFLAHRDELIQQAVDKLLTVLPERTLEVGVVKADGVVGGEPGAF